jgi:hypothetical protein
MLRRAMAIGIGVVLLILLALLINSCRQAQKEQAFKDYVRDVESLVQDSDRQSDDFFALLSNPGDLGAVDIQNRMAEFRGEAGQLVDRAEDTDHPDEADAAHRYLVDALAFRRDGSRARCRPSSPATSSTRSASRRGS